MLFIADEIPHQRNGTSSPEHRIHLPQQRTEEQNSALTEHHEHHMRDILESYFQNFTIHGLARVFIGRCWEQLLWLAVLVAAIGFVIYAGYGFIQEYKAFDIVTDIKVKSGSLVTLPAISICPTSLLDVACYENKTLRGKDCVTKSQHLIDKIAPDRRKYVIQHPIFPDSCIVINPYGNLTVDKLESIYIYDQNNIEKSYSFYIHSHYDVIKMTDLPTIPPAKLKGLVVKFSKKELIWRLPSPYSSNCSNGNKDINIFPGPYTIAKCKNTCLFKKMLSDCGDVIQQWQTYLLPGMVDGKKRGAFYCLRNFFYLYDLALECDCPVSCHELHIDTTFEVRDGLWFPFLSFKYLSNTFTEIREVPAYPANKLITDIGGWLSLFTGSSVLSLLEIFIFISLSIIALFQNCIAIRRNDR